MNLQGKRKVRVVVVDSPTLCHGVALVSDPNGQKDTHMRRTLLGIVAAAALAVPLLGVFAPANATEGDDTPYVLAAWQRPDDGSGWPQQLVAFTDTAAVSLDLLDAQLAARPGCHQYQIDLYNDSEAIYTLLAFGVLGGENSPPEPGVVTWKYLTTGADCDPPCTKYIVATFEMPGFDPVVGKTFPQTLTSVSEPTCTPEFPPPPDCKNTQMDIFRADGPLTAAYLADGILTEAEGNDTALWAEMFEGGSGNSWRLYPATNCPMDATANVTITPPTCDAPSGVSVAGLLFATLVGSLDLTVGDHTATFKADAGHLFANGTDTLTVSYTIRAKDTTSDECIPDIGGKTLGYYKNHTVTNAQWLNVKGAYPAAFGSYTTSWTGANGGLSILSASGSTNNGRDMLRAQFLATSLNVLTITGYGAQKIDVPASSAVDGGQRVTVTKYLSDVNAAWASLTTKAQITSVKDVLDAINQDAPSSLFV